MPRAVNRHLLRLAWSISLITACAERAPIASAVDAAPTLPPAPGAEGTAPKAHDPNAAPPSAPLTSAQRPERLEPSYILPELANGRAQSPINIETSSLAPSKHGIRFHYQPTLEHVDNLGHTVKVTYDAGSSLDYDGTSYSLLQFHFHTPSEHLLDGVTYPMELHIVHAEQGHPEHLLVVGVLFKEGEPSPWLDALLADVPGQAGEHADKDARIDIGSVLAREGGYYHYEGSLTTPPYSESVTWLVLEQPRTASAEQIEALNRIEGNNARHIQARNARSIEHIN
jgi:carbonic anhydrase